MIFNGTNVYNAIKGKRIEYFDEKTEQNLLSQLLEINFINNYWKPGFSE